MKVYSNGHLETRSRATIVGAKKQLAEATQYQDWLRLGGRDGGIGDPSKEHGVKHRKVLCDLPYWQVCMRNHINFC